MFLYLNVLHFELQVLVLLTITYIIAPAANANIYGSIGVTRPVKSIVIIAPIGSTIPDNTPSTNAFNFDFPSLLKALI